MTNIRKIILPVALVAICAMIVFVIISNPPTSKRGRPKQAPQLAVDVETLKSENYQVNVASYGTVRPRTQSVLLPQVSGQITYISDNFRNGGFFQQGEVLVRIDQRDYLAEIKIAQANLYSAEQALIEEQARVAQAKQDWQRLGNSDQAPELVLRKPQLLAAEARVASAQATLSRAELAFERTEIIAPYTGRVLQQRVDLGQVVSPGTQLADIYAVDYVEIRLPIRNKDLAYMVLPEQGLSAQSLPAVNFVSDLVGQQRWQGKVVRTEGAFDNASQQLFVVAQINDPYGIAALNQNHSNQQRSHTSQNNGQLPIKIGQYLTATIAGNIVQDAIIIPNKTVYQGSYVYLVEDGVLTRQNIEISWQNQEIAMVSKGLSADQLLVTTPLGQVNSGTRVEINRLDGIAQTNKGNKHGTNAKAGKGRKRKNASTEQTPAKPAQLSAKNSGGQS